MRPSLAQIPKIIEFLGLDPFETHSKNLADKIKAYRRVRGVSQKKLAELLGVNQTTLAGWEKGRHQPTKRLLDKLFRISANFATGTSTGSTGKKTQI